MDSFYMVIWHLCVYIVVYPLSFYMSWWNGQVLMNTRSSISMARHNILDDLCNVSHVVQFLSGVAIVRSTFILLAKLFIFIVLGSQRSIYRLSYCHF
jgi:hypothetical protein